MTKTVTLYYLDDPKYDASAWTFQIAWRKPWDNKQSGVVYPIACRSFKDGQFGSSILDNKNRIKELDLKLTVVA